MAGLIFLLVVGATLCLLFYLTVWRDRLIRSKPFPESWLATVVATLPIYPSLSGAEQSRLQQLILLFIARKRFYGCGGLDITDEIRERLQHRLVCYCLIRVGRYTQNSLPYWFIPPPFEWSGKSSGPMVL